MDLLPKKRFGQHFLRDRAILDRILRQVEPAKTDLFIEVGAGTGLLTSRIAGGGAPVYAIEVDHDLIPALRHATAAFPNVTVIESDILRIDLSSLLGPELPGRRLRAVGNLPYNIATAVIEMCLTSPLPFHDLTFMTQIEVAERIVARPGSRAYGYLSVMCQHLAAARIAFKVAAGSFSPPPKVTSAVLLLNPHAPQPDRSQTLSLAKVAKAAFAHRRKMLSNSLSQNAVIGPKSDTLLARAGVQGSRRAEQLSVREYEELARVYAEMF